MEKLGEMLIALKEAVTEEYPQGLPSSDPILSLFQTAEMVFRLIIVLFGTFRRSVTKNMNFGGRGSG